jgi:hypothetical protein
MTSPAHPEWLSADGRIIHPNAPTGGGGPGGFVTAGPLRPSPLLASSLPHPQSPAARTLDPIHVHRGGRPKTNVAVVAFGWPGKEHRTTGFILSAKTKQ